MAQKQEICTIHSNQFFVIKKKWQSNVRNGIKFVALFVKKRHGFVFDQMVCHD